MKTLVYYDYRDETMLNDKLSNYSKMTIKNIFRGYDKAILIDNSLINESRTFGLNDTIEDMIDYMNPTHMEIRLQDGNYKMLVNNNFYTLKLEKQN